MREDTHHGDWIKRLNRITERKRVRPKDSFGDATEDHSRIAAGSPIKINLNPKNIFPPIQKFFYFISLKPTSFNQRHMMKKLSCLFMLICIAFSIHAQQYR